jgi:hypothetical protein
MNIPETANGKLENPVINRIGANLHAELLEIGSYCEQISRSLKLINGFPELREREEMLKKNEGAAIKRDPSDITIMDALGEAVGRARIQKEVLQLVADNLHKTFGSDFRENALQERHL